MLLLIGSAAQAAVLGGVAWVPAGIGDVSWSEDKGFSGTLVGEYDGWLRPPLTASLGWVGKHDGLLGNVAFVQFSTESFADSNARTIQGSARLGIDYRRYLFTREAGRVGGYGLAGVYGIIPHVEDINDAYSDSEQEDATQAAADVAARVGGFGGQIGIGGEYLFGDKQGRPAVALGARYLLRAFRGQIADDEGLTVSAVWTTEAALTLEFTR